MKEAPISLQNYFATDLLLSTNHAYRPDLPLMFKEPEFIVEVSTNRSETSEQGLRQWQVTLEVRHQPGPETNFSYAYRVVLVGLFSVSPHVKPEDEERMVRIQGASVLYGMTREIIRVLTGRGPYRPVLIPTVSFYEQKQALPNALQNAQERKISEASAISKKPKIPSKKKSSKTTS